MRHQRVQHRWRHPSGYYADGAGGQRIVGLPDLDMVVVTTGDGGSDDYGVLATLLNTYILPAAESKTPLPANPDGAALLESRIKQVAAAPQPEAVSPLPEIAQQVSGQTYVLDANPLDEIRNVRQLKMVMKDGHLVETREPEGLADFWELFF